MTRTITTAAAIEAERRWGADIISTIPAARRTPSQWHDSGMASGFVLGAQWLAALPLLTVAPSATREEVEAVLERVMDEAAYDDGTIAHDTEKRLADALLARFNITPKEDR